MRRIHVLSCWLVLGVALGGAQSGPTKILISSRTDPATAGQEAAAIASYFENRVQELLMDKYPCADPLTMGDVKALLEWDRQRELLDANYQGGLATIAGALGAQYVISLTVAPLGSGQVALHASMMDAASIKTVANTSSITGGGSAALKGVDALAQQLVQGLGGLSRFSKERCEPTNPWVGTVTYRVDSNRRGQEESKPLTGEGTITLTTEVDSSYEATVRIGWTGEPKARVIATETRRNQEVGKIRFDCGRPGIAQRNVPNWKSAGYDNLTLAESSAAGDSPGSVSVSLVNGKIGLQFNLAALEGTTRTTVRNKFDGRCGEPTSSNQTADSPWEVRDVQERVEVPAGADPDEQAGSFTNTQGGKVTWKLTRTPMRK
jgi:hypothetical protein